MLEYTFRPLSKWPQESTPSHRRRNATFRAGYLATLDLLERELVHLKAKEVIFEADCPSSDIRNDGRLRSTAKLRSPGIVVSFESAKGPMRFPCDKFLDWEDNLRAIALTLDIIRPGIVATAVLKDVVTASDDPWFEGRFGWVLDEVIVLPKPIACPGAQGLWTVPQSIAERLAVP